MIESWVNSAVKHLSLDQKQGRDAQKTLSGTLGDPTRRRNALMIHASLLFSLGLLLFTVGFCGCSMIGPLVNTAAPFAGAKLMFACIPEHTQVDTPFGPKPIENLEPGHTVIGFSGKPVLILQKHSYLEDSKTLFLRIDFHDGAAVDLCGMHRLAGLRACEIRVGQTVASREVIGIEHRSGVTHSYDLLTEDKGYRIDGVPVNSMIDEMTTAAALIAAGPVVSQKGGRVP